MTRLEEIRAQWQRRIDAHNADPKTGWMVRIDEAWPDVDALLAVAEAAKAHREADNTIQHAATQPHTSGGQDAFRDAIRAKVSAERALFAALDALEARP